MAPDDRTKSIAVAVHEAAGGNTGQAVRMLATLYGINTTTEAVKRWVGEAVTPDPIVARDLPQTIAAVRMGTVAPLIDAMRRRVLRLTRARTTTSKDLLDETRALSLLLQAFDPTSAPGGQRGMQLPAAGAGFVAWGPLPEGVGASTVIPAAAVVVREAEGSAPRPGEDRGLAMPTGER